MAVVNLRSVLQSLSFPVRKGGLRFYAKDPLENRSMEALLSSVGGGRGGRGGRGRKKGGKKAIRLQPEVVLGSGGNNVRWGGLSHPLSISTSTGRLRYGPQWLETTDFGMTQVSDDAGTMEDSVLEVRQLEGPSGKRLPLSMLNWSRSGWSGRSWGGRYVGCPELPDGTPLTDFSSTVIELKRVSNQTKAGKKRTVSCLVVVGNGNGVAGYAVGRGEEIRAAIRKAKNKAVNALQYIPRYSDHTVYHNVKVKYCRTNILMERKVAGYGLKCQRAIHAICKLVGIENLKAKIIGSNNPLNIVHATMKGLTSQQTHQSLADEEEKFLVEFHDECGSRPVVSSVPKSMQSNNTARTLKDMQLLRAA